MTPKEQLSSSIQAEQCTSEEMHPSDVAIRKRLHKRLQRLLGEVLGEYALIAPGDRILLGISGGKDSLALLDLLGERMLRSNHSFSLEAIHAQCQLCVGCKLSERKSRSVEHSASCRRNWI